MIEAPGRLILSLQRCRQRKDLDLARLLYSQMYENELETDQDLCNYVVSMLVDCGSMPDALHAFDRLIVSNELAWTSLIQGWTECGCPQNSLIAFSKMQEAAVYPSKHTFVAVLKACSRLKQLEKGRNVHMTVVRMGFEDNSFIGNTVVDLYAKLGLLQEANSVLQRLENQNAVTWNALIKGYVEHGYYTDSLCSLSEMESLGLSPDHVTFACCIMACMNLGDADTGNAIHARAISQGFEKAEAVVINLVDMYVTCGLLTDACAVFDKTTNQNVMLWTSLIKGYTEHGSAEDAIKCVEKMQVQGVSPDEITFVCSLKACISTKCISKGQELHEEIVVKGMEGNTFVGNTLMDMYANCALLEEARHTFDQMEIHTVVSWNVILTGYVDHGFYKEFLLCLKQMQSAQTPPDSTTLSCSLRASGLLRAIGQGRDTHNTICKEGLDKDIFVANTVVDMYTKCGFLLDALKVFDQLPVQNLVSWNTLIAGCVEHEQSEHALRFFEQMKSKGIHADSATYIGCLKACGHLKLLKEGMKMHIKIVKDGLEAEPFVDNGLLDVYGKCGCLAEAQDLFERLPVQNVVSWSTLISGFAENERGEDALRCLEMMQAAGVSPNDVTHIASLKACGSLGATTRGQELHAEVMNMLFENNTFLNSSVDMGNNYESTEVDYIGTGDPMGNVIVDMYCKCGSMPDAELIISSFSRMDEVARNTVVAGYARHGETRMVLELYEIIKQQGAQLDSITFLSVLTACSHAGLVDEGKEYFVAMGEEYNIAPGVLHYNCVIDLLGRAGQFKLVSNLLENLPIEPDTNTWYTLMGACSKWGNAELGRLAFDSAVKLDKSNAAAYIVFSNMHKETQDAMKTIQEIMQFSTENPCEIL